MSYDRIPISQFQEPQCQNRHVTSDRKIKEGNRGWGIERAMYSEATGMCQGEEA